VSAEEQMRKVLLISYRFPPQGGGGVQRTLKFTKYLRDFGWEPVVQTARNPYWPLRDDSLLEDVPPGVHVYRTPSFEFERLEQRLASLAGQKTERGGGAANGGGATSPARGGGRGRGGMMNAIRGAVHRRLLVPDAQIAWLPGALAHSLKIARREGIRVVYTTSPPNSVQILGGLVAKLLRRPWVADFRDPWTDGPRRQRAYVDNGIRERIERAAERWIVRRADRVLVSAEPLRTRFLAKYPFLRPEKVIVLTNGFDPSDFDASEDSGRDLEPAHFHVSGAGNIEAMFDARPLFQALAGAMAAEPELAQNLHVNLIGARKGKYEADIRALGLTGRVRYIGWVHHAQSLRYLSQSDVLLMCQLPHAGGGGEKLSVKFFEYLYLRKPILCLSVPGLTADLLAESGLGTVVHPDDVEGIKSAILRLYARRAEAPRANASLIARFDRRTLTGQLASIFDELDGARESAWSGAHPQVATGPRQ
jgi:glycosyltransferase involved in cell wall biosynthesis